MADAYILGIESSCDETSAAVVRSGEQTISNVVLSQIATHRPYGGVVPELASREHLKAIVPVVKTALAEAQRDYSTVDAIAVTRGPGLAGALLVGISFAKALAFATGKPLMGIRNVAGPDFREDTYVGHLELAYMIRARDEARVIEAIERHLEASYARVLASYPDESPLALADYSASKSRTA